MTQQPRPPRVTLGVPVYNGEAYLEETLHSLLAQDFTDLEVVVSDNGSTDATPDICRNAMAADPRVSYHRSAVNQGAAWNYNRVLELARGELFKWAAADDICAPGFVSRCVQALDAGGPGVVLAWPQTLLIDAHGAPMGPLDDSDLDLRQDSPAHRLDTLLRHRVEWHPVFGVIRTEALRRTPGIGVFPCADVALLAELSLYGEFHQVPEPLFLRRYHDERSIVAGPSFVEQVAWYDPRRRVRHVFPMARLTRELLAGVGRSPVRGRDAAACRAAVLRRWGLPHWRHIGGELKLAARAELRRPAKNRLAARR